MNAEDYNLPKQTHDIFAIMARGHFISSNGTKDKPKKIEMQKDLCRERKKKRQDLNQITAFYSHPTQT